MHKIVLDGQTLRWYGAEPIIVSDSINQVRFEFIRLNGWENVVLTAQFTQSGTTYSVATQNDTAALPAEITAGALEISVFGSESGRASRFTVEPLSLIIRASGFVPDGVSPIPPTPDLYAQWVETVEEERKKAETAALNAEEASSEAAGSMLGALTAKRETEQAAADALQSIAEAETSAVQAVENTGREQSEAVAAAGDTQIGRINTASDTALKNIADTKAGALAEVTTEGGKQIGLIGDTAAGALDDIKSAKDGALTEISAEGTTQVGNVQTAGTAQIGAVQAAGAEVIAAAQQAQQECAADKIAAEAAKAEAEKAQAAIGANGANMFASPIWQKASGASVSVTPAAGSNFDVQLNGATIQPGTGDPSPTNIRPIYGVGQYDKKIVIDGNTIISAVVNVGTYTRFAIDLRNNTGAAATNAYCLSSIRPYSLNLGYSADAFHVYVTNNYCYLFDLATSIEEFSAKLAQHPEAVYYQSTAYATAEQVYVGLSITDANGYHGYAAGPMAPLYDGDTLDFVSGECIRNKYRKIFDNSAVITWGEVNVTTPKGASPYSNASGFGVGSVCNTFAQGSLESFMGTSPSQTGPVYIWRTAYLASLGITTKEQLTAALSSNQMVVVYPISPTTETVAISEPIPLPPGQSDKYNPQPTVIAAADGTVTVGYNMDGTAAYNTIKTAIAALGGT